MSLQVPLAGRAPARRRHASSRIGRRAGGRRCPGRQGVGHSRGAVQAAHDEPNLTSAMKCEELLRPFAAGCQTTTEGDMSARSALEVARPADGTPPPPVAAVRAPTPFADLPS